jgi:hypothetical protein
VLGEPPEDPLLLFRVLNAFWSANLMAFNGDACRDLAAQYLALAEKRRATVPLMSGHRMVGISLLYTGTSQKPENIWTRRFRVTILPSIVRRQRALAQRVGC